MKTTLMFTSSSFKSGSEIPKKFTCQGENISPQLSWYAEPSKNVGGYVLIVDDPDAQKVVDKTFVHWIVLLPAQKTELPEGISSKQSSAISENELRNDFRTTNYGGPCPPKGTGVHTYRFTLFAVKENIEKLQRSPSFPKAPFTAEQFKDALGDSIIGEALITGTYVQI